MLQRIHPAQSRVKRLAAETPALLIVFDLLADIDGRSLTHLPLRERRRRLEAFARRYLRSKTRIRLSPATTKLREAKVWLKDVGAVLDGIIAKRCDLEYRSGDRTGRSAQWQPVRPELVVEVRYDHFTGHRFRHGTKLLRWRPDKSPRQCTMDQVTQKATDLTGLLT